MKTANIGSTTSAMKDQLDELKAQIFTGASHVELGFMGVDKGSVSGGRPTPGIFGKDQREEMRQLSKINKTTLSTHASLGVMGLAGTTERGGFSETARIKALDEVKAAIEFNADVGGSAVVVHLGEFNRPTGEREISEGIKERKGFIDYGEGVPQYFVDKRTGDPLFSFTKDKEVILPHYKYNPETGKHYWDKEIVKFDGKTMEDAKTFFERYLKKEIAMEQGRSDQFAREADEELEKIQMLKKAKTPEEKKAIINGLPPYIKNALMNKGLDEDQIFKFLLEKERQDFLDHKSTAEGFHRAVAQTEETIKNISTAREYALQKTKESVSDLGIYAMNQTQDKRLKDPIFIAPESIFPEQYGSHPEELKEVVIESRKRMQEKLVQKGMDKEEAKELAAKHIKATFDIGHAYTWKKYYKGNEKDFNKWVIQQADQLLKEGIIGHVHVTDNMGYADDHLPMGEGKVPIEKFTEVLSKRNFEGKIIAEAGDRDFSSEPGAALKHAWKTMGSPIYRIDMGTYTPLPTIRPLTRSWTEIEGSYFGRTGSPTYIVGEKLIPSKDWVFWTEQPME
ncbi:MAG: TIM barrel protein [Candidatus Nanoarchaeia archaeon]|nr:TIM barrel protein [Candidatus Nanoarchaeia archaeon]